MNIVSKIFKSTASNSQFLKELTHLLGFKPHKTVLYFTALSHRSIKDAPEDNNERLEYLGDAILSAVVADYLFKRYPYKGEGFLTEMRSKMVNRQRLNDIAVKMGVKRIILYNKTDGTLKNSHIFGNALESLVGAVYLDAGYLKTRQWVLKQIVIPHMFVDDLEHIDINLKNKLIGWASKHNKNLLFDFVEEKKERGRKVFTINTVLDGKILSQGKGFTKKDASHMAAQIAIEKLGL
jgi:ribonuclease-3